MRPPKTHEAHEDGDGLRAGFEVRVIGAARHAPAPHEGKGLEIGLQIGTGQTNAEPEKLPATPVQRLHAEDPPEPVRARPISEVIGEVGPAAPYVPRRGRKASLTTWTLWMAVGTCILAVAAVAGFMKIRAEQAPPPDAPIVFTPKDSFGEEKAYFLEHMGEVSRDAEALLGRYIAAKSADAVLPLVRNAPQVQYRLKALWEPMADLSTGQAIESLFFDNEICPAFILKGRTADFKKFDMFFVRENGHLKIDWEASFGIGDSQLSELRKSKSVVKGTKVRVVAEPASFYTPEFPEDDYRSYQLIDATGEEFVWAFVRRSSRTADLLEAEFNESSVLLEKTKANPVTLRISGPLHEGVNLFEITEMLHKGWVSP